MVFIAWLLIGIGVVTVVVMLGFLVWMWRAFGQIERAHSLIVAEQGRQTARERGWL